MNNPMVLVLLGLGLLFIMSPRRSDAKSLIRRFEGLSLSRYVDASGKEHIGYGHLIKPGEDYTSITPGQAEWLLEQDMRTAVDCVSRLVSVPLSTNQHAALVSFVYNVGCGAFQDSTLLRLLNAGNVTGAADEFLKWNKAAGVVAQGLVDRRFIERDVFLGVG